MTATSTTAIVGLPPAENIVSIDYRPATGQLYALGLLEFILLMRKVVLQLLCRLNCVFSYSWANASLDFNPTVDRIRLVTASGQI
jgi:hypothetical protein